MKFFGVKNQLCQHLIYILQIFGNSILTHSTNEAHKFFSALNTILNFSQYHHIFDIFQTCTVHISYLGRSNVELQESYILNCHSKINTFCINILTGMFYPNENKNGTKYNKILWEYWKLTLFEDLTPIHKKLFFNFRFTSVCILQIPHVGGSTLKSLEKYFLRILNVQHELSIAKPKYLKQPDYVLLPFARSEETNKISITDLSLTPKIILLDPYNYNIYLACTPCLESYNFYTADALSSIPFILFPQNFFNLDSSNQQLEIDHFWKESFFGVHSLQANLQLFSTDDLNDHCPYNGKLWELSDFFTSYEPIYCIKYYIRKSINCTSVSCKRVLTSNLKFGKHSDLHHISAYGSQIHGFKYSVFVNKQVTKDLGFGTNITAFVAPFDILDWIFILATFIFMGIVLLQTSFLGNPFFWLFAVTIEQETNKRRSVNISNWHLILLWMIASHLFRILYGSSLYTYMTKEAEPVDIPRKFKDLVSNKNLQILSDRTTLEYFTHHSKSVHQKDYLAQLWKSTLEKYWWYRGIDLNALRYLAGDQISGNVSKPYICQWVTDARISVTDNLNLTFESSKFSKYKSCVEWPRFALLFHTSSAGFVFKEDMSVYAKLVLILFGRFNVLENEDHLRFSEMYFWSFDKRNYVFELVDSKLAGLIESGILSMQNHYFEIRIQLNVLAEFLKGQTSKESWSKLSLAFQMVSKHTSIGWSKSVSRLLSLGGFDDKSNIQKGTMEDFKFVWLLVGGLSMINVIVFLSEIFKRKKK